MAVTTGPAPVLPPVAAVATARVRPALVLIAAAVLALVLLTPVAVAVSSGWRALIVRSPSMGRTAPVGSLVIAAPVRPGALDVGDVVTYRPPQEHGTTYTHRIVDVVPGGFRTRGDINGADDPWLVAPGMVLGRVSVVVPGLGWALRVLPWVAIGLVVVWAATWPIRSDRTRSGLRLLGACCSATATLLVLRPIAGYTLLTTSPAPGGLLATVVSTGLLPVRVTAAGGRSAELAPGAVTRLLLPASPEGHVQLTSAIALDLVGWCCLVAVCALPLIGVLVVGLPAEEAKRSG